MNSLKILIVEDDISFSVELEMLVQDIGYEVVAVAENGEEALKLIIQNEPDLILMDISLETELSGMDVAEKIQYLKIPILFITSYAEKELYQRSKKVSSIGYLVKPIKEFSLRSAIEMAIRTVEAEQIQTEQEDAFSTNKAMYLKKKGVFYKVMISDILYFQADDNYVIIYLKNDRFIAKTKIKDIEKMLQGRSFLKVHRSFIINLKKISSIDFRGSKINIGKQSIPMNRSVKSFLKDKVKDFL